MRYRGKLRFAIELCKERGSRALTDPIREFQTVPCKVVKVDSEHISTAHIEWPEGKQSSESCGCRRSHLIILDVVVVAERKQHDRRELLSRHTHLSRDNVPKRAMIQ